MDFSEISEYADPYAVKSVYDRVFAGEIRFLSARGSSATNSSAHGSSSPNSPAPSFGALKHNNNINGKVKH